MQISYEARYDGSSKPKLCKVVCSDDGSEEIITPLQLANSDELALIEDDTIWQHMENLVDYIKITAPQIELVAQGVQPDDGWPIIGWPAVAKLNDEAVQWWVYLTYRDEPVEVIHNLMV